MRLSLIAAMDPNRVIGKGSGLPWPHCPSDMRRFKHLTLGKPVIMGRKTWDSLPGVLQGRKSVILSTSMPVADFGDWQTVPSVEAALKAVNHEPEVMVIGGAEIYEQFFPYVNRMYLTEFNESWSGDVCFPEYELGRWHPIYREMCLSGKSLEHSFSIYDRLP